MVLDGFSIPRICKIRGLFYAKSKAMITQTAVQFKNLNFLTVCRALPGAFYSLFRIESLRVAVAGGLSFLYLDLNPPSTL